MHVNICVAYFSLETEHLEICSMLAFFSEGSEPTVGHFCLARRLNGLFLLCLAFDFIPLIFHCAAVCQLLLMAGLARLPKQEMGVVLIMHNS